MPSRKRPYSIAVRISAEEKQALRTVANRLDRPESALVRAGLRAVVADPRLVYSAYLPAPANDDADQPTGLPPRRRKRGKR